MFSRPIAVAATKPPSSAVSRPPKSRKQQQSSQPRVKPAAKDSNEVWRVFQVNVAAHDEPGKDDFSAHPQLLQALSKKLSCKNPDKLDASNIQVVRKSFDSRKRNRKCWTYVVDVPSSALKSSGAKHLTHIQNQFELLLPGNAIPPQIQQQQQQQKEKSPSSVPSPSSSKQPDPVVVIGCGPAGLFAALTLAEAGIKVILLERGQPVEVRGRDIGALFVRRQGNPESNLCYGEGGAGTWSDGKLTTRIGRNSDPVRKVLETLVNFGAPEAILLSGKPHLGTDRLVRILRAFREHLLAQGAEIRFGTCVSDLIVQGGKIRGVKLRDGSEIAASKVVLAVGHSARDMYSALRRSDVAISPKPFAMGFRIEHPQALIDELQYGEADAREEVHRGRGRFPVAEYRLAAELVMKAEEQQLANKNTVYGNEDESVVGKRGVFSFCMCPGGQIVPTSTNPEELCINGMSFSRRNSLWANSALVVTTGPGDWEHLVSRHGALAGMQLQMEIERAAASLGGGDFTVPVQRATDYMSDNLSKGSLPSSSYRLGTKPAPLHQLYNSNLTSAFKAALERFNQQLPGYVCDDALLHAAETRTSAPVRVDRDAQSMQSVNVAGLYPCGEGAGYAGGIVSAAVDGLKVGQMVLAEVTGLASFADAAAEFKTPSGGY